MLVPPRQASPSPSDCDRGLRPYGLYCLHAFASTGTPRSKPRTPLAFVAAVWCSVICSVYRPAVLLITPRVRTHDPIRRELSQTFMLRFHPRSCRQVLAEKHSGLTMTCFVPGGGHTNLCWGALALHVDTAVLRFLGRVSMYSGGLPYDVEAKMLASARAEASDMAARLADTEAGVRARFLNGKRQKHTRRSWSSALRSGEGRPLCTRTISCTVFGTTSLAGSTSVVLQPSREDSIGPYRRTATITADSFPSSAPYSRTSFASSGVSSTFYLEDAAGIHATRNGLKDAGRTSDVKAGSISKVRCAREQRTPEGQINRSLSCVFQSRDESGLKRSCGDAKGTPDEVEVDFSTSSGSRTSSSLESLPPLRYTESTTQLHCASTEGGMQTTARQVRTSTFYSDSVGAEFTKEASALVGCRSGSPVTTTTTKRSIKVVGGVSQAQSKIDLTRHALGVRMSTISSSALHGIQSVSHAQAAVKRYASGSFSVFHNAGSYDGTRDSVLMRSIFSQ